MRRTTPARHRPDDPPARRARSSTRPAPLLLAVVLSLLLPFLGGAAASAGSPPTGGRGGSAGITVGGADTAGHVSSRRGAGVRPSSAAALPMTLSIDDVSPATLTVGRPIEVSATVTNNSSRTYTRLRASLWMPSTPASQRAGLTEITSVPTSRPQGSRLDSHTLAVGNLAAGESQEFSIKVPYDDLGLDLGTTGTQAGVYPVSVSVEASYGPVSDTMVAADRTLVALPPLDTSRMHGVSSVLMVPVSAPVVRLVNGDFVDERLGESLATGRLRHVLDAATAAPPGTMTIAVDPALVRAARAMATGYRVRRADTPIQKARRGRFAAQSREWVRDLVDVGAEQDLVLLPWGTPDVQSLSRARMSTVVRHSMRASVEFAGRFTPFSGARVVAWQPGGMLSRRAIRNVDASAASTQVVNVDSLPELYDDTDPDAYPRSWVALRGASGPMPVVAASSRMGGIPLRPDTTGLELRQALLAEGVVRAMTPQSPPVQTFALPFNWNPGPDAISTDMSTTYSPRLVSGGRLLDLQVTRTEPYRGEVEGDRRLRLPDRTLALLPTYRRARVRVLDMLVRPRRGESRFSEQLAEGASAWWAMFPRAGVHQMQRLVDNARGDLASIDVGVPSFVTQSSASGKFPISVSNNLAVPVDVSLRLTPDNSDISFTVPTSVRLRAGQRSDIQVNTHADGSGLASVRVWVVTPGGYRVSGEKTLQVRSTQIGLVIWVLMGTGLAVLLGAAAIRLARRIRRHEMQPRQEPGGA